MKNSHPRLLVVLLLLCSVTIRASHAADNPTIPPPDKLLTTLARGHPRLLARAGDFQAIKQAALNNSELAAWCEKLKLGATKILSEEPSKYEIPDGKRLLATSRRVRDRVTVLALVYRLTGDRRFADRAWSELNAAAAFKDWNPKHFLDTAEMTCAFAIGYDWLYDVWTTGQRSVLRAAIVEKGLNPAMDCYKKNLGWPAARHNWNQVCNGGIGMGALAVADELPEFSATVLNFALNSLPLAMHEFAPDGAWAEGPGYWKYATDYTVYFLASLDSALGTDFGLSRIPGLSKTGMFPIYFTGPTGLVFNFADAHGGKFEGAPQLFWLASKFNQPDLAAYQLKYTKEKAAPMDLIFGRRWVGRPLTMATLPLDGYFRKAEVVTMRSSWEDQKALFVGFKAGDNKANHSHLDTGSFVLDALGQRWVCSLGSDNYNLPGYFGNARWDYYRLRAEGKNTLVLNPGPGPDQNPKAATSITRFKSKPDLAFAIADLTQAYAASANKVERGIQMLDRKEVIVQDEITAARPVDLWWFIHTRARIELGTDATSATLAIGKEKLSVRLFGPDGARFKIMPAAPLPSSPNPEGQGQNKEQKLAIWLPHVKSARIAVIFVPLTGGTNPPSIIRTIRPLADW